MQMEEQCAERLHDQVQILDLFAIQDCRVAADGGQLPQCHEQDRAHAIARTGHELVRVLHLMGI